MIRLAQPWGLLVLVFFVFVVLRLRALGARSALRRGAAWLCLALALAGPELHWPGEPEPVVLVVDVSDSVSRSLAAGLERLRTMLRRAPTSGSTGIVAFAGQAHVVRPLAPKGMDGDADLQRLAVDGEIAARADPRDTDIASALTLAGRLLAPGQPARIVLASDGHETVGDARQAAGALSDRRIAVDVVPLGSLPPGFRDAAIDDVEAPAHVRAGMSFELRLLVRCTVEGLSTVSLRVPGATVARQDVKLRTGLTEVRFTVERTTPGEHAYTVEVALHGDQEPRNDAAAVSVSVLGRPRILWVGRPPVIEPGPDVEIVHAPPHALTAASGMRLPWDTIVLADVDASSLPAGAADLLRRYVASEGGGLVMVGGPQSFGLGGYRGTPVEEALPVDLDPAGRRTRTPLALVLALDKSGSMAEPLGRVSKMDAAREAALITASLLEPGDRFAVIAFDAAPTVSVPLGEPPPRDDLSRALGQVQPGGGTRLLPAIGAATAVLEPLRGMRRHAVLVTDGRGEGGDFERRARELAAGGITLSTVAVGDDADVELLGSLASAGQGRFERVRDAGKLTAVLRRDLLLARGPVLRQGRTRVLATAHAALGALAHDRVPAVLGYVSTAPKPSAVVPLRAEGGDPILALGDHGLGRTAALTSDLGGPWSPSWRGWNDASALLAGVLSWTSRVPVTGSVVMSQVPSADGVQLAVRLEDADGRRVNGRAIAARIAGEPERIVALDQRGPGLYVGPLPARITRPTRVVLEERSARGHRAGAQGWIGLGYAEEHRLREPDRSLLEDIRRATGGRWLEEGDSVLPLGMAGTRVVRLSSWLAVVALALFLVDLAGGHAARPPWWRRLRWPAARRAGRRP